MVPPSSETGMDDDDVGQQKGTPSPQCNRRESSSISEECRLSPSLIDTPRVNVVAEPSRPKSEEPASNVSRFPGEAATCHSAPNSDGDGPPPLSRESAPRISDSISGVDSNLMHEIPAGYVPYRESSNPVEPRAMSLRKTLFKTPKERPLETAENERRLEEAAELFRQSLIIHTENPAAVQDATPATVTTSHDNNEVQIVDTGHQSSPIQLDSEAEDALAAASFNSCKKSYERKKKRGQNSVEDDIAFTKARRAEELRLKLQSRKRAFVEVDSDDDPLFVAEGTSSAIDSSAPKGDSDVVAEPESRKKSRPNKIPESLLQEAAQIGCDALNADERKASSKKREPRGPRKSRVPKTRTPGSKDKKQVEGLPNAKRGRRRKGPEMPKGPEMLNIQTLFNNDIVSAAQANVGKAAQPGFTSKNKKDALAELIASIPEAERTTHNADKNALEKATRSFSGHAAMKADGNNGWRLRGMETSLYHYQLLGAAFMRDRENSSSRPYGGLQADEMGLGKTVTCLANIIDGRAPPGSPNRTTLIVCPAALCSQWLSEIKKHVSPTTFQEVIMYRAGSRVESADPTKTLAKADVIITSYHEVMRSYPHCKTPMHLVTPEAKTQWWSTHFNNERGPLHRIYFRRIVLDEAQAIKNHSSKTSIAIRSLSGKYRWAISGTPIQNSLEEFFPFFSFLKVPHTGSYETFKNNFAGGNSTTNLRLQSLLRRFMIRRTHLDSIFGRPLLQLPGITTRTVEVEFNECEKAIYKIVKNRFIQRIRTFVRSGELNKKYQSIFVLFLRLRQMVGHILLVQQTLKDLMESEDLEKLWRLTEAESQPSADKQSHVVLAQLRKMLSQNSDVQAAPRNEAPQPDPADALTDGAGARETADDVGGTFGTAFRFRKYLRTLKETGKWEQMNERSLCHKCGGVPDNPHVTSCYHVYCKECLEAMLFEAARTGMDKANCLACDALFEHTEPCRGFDQAGTMLSTSSVGGQDHRSRKSADSDDSDIDWISVGGSILPSAKTLAVKAQIRLWIEEDPAAKIIIFTQFRDMIRILSRMMQEEGWGSSQFHGSMSFLQRDKAVLDFGEKPEIKVLLASLKAGGVGLNLTMASKVIIVDLWWNESVEQQAFCRCFRIGQDRQVDICRIVVKNSIDDDILAMQARKTEEIDLAMAAKNQPGRMTTQELLRLFGPFDCNEDGEKAAVGDPFIFVDDEEDDDDKSDNGMPTRVPAPSFM